MFDYEARHIIEALRSGIPSRAIGHYFSEARPLIMQEIRHDLDDVRTIGTSRGKIISGKYGEGKTHLLNTIFNLAHENNMVVSIISLSKETPLDKLYLIYQKVMNNTFLPKKEQPGIMQEFEHMHPESTIANEMLLFTAKQLETDKLYYVLRSYLNTDDQDEKYMLQTDLEGDYISNTQVKQLYRRIFSEKVTFQNNFNKYKHCQDYFALLSHLFRLLGYAGWVLLFDETELIGRTGKKTRMKAYTNMSHFLFPQKRFEAMYNVFAISSSFIEDVIEGKHEYENLQALEKEMDTASVKRVLDTIRHSSQLVPLTKSEITGIIQKLIFFHGRAYDWNPQIDMNLLKKQIDGSGYLLRTKIRSAIEYLDQMLQYGKVGETTIRHISTDTYGEEPPDLQSLLE
ncbi:MAG: DUF2791 family P-loop domain-containing protein [Sphaerochaetaceae bacterium]|nr:DUF2791 family P-loop domain-containing protein [Sphaerochaetaceae bacterium]